VVAPAAPAAPAAAAVAAAKAAAEESALKAKQTYDFVVPAKIDWSKTCWPKPMVDAIHLAQDTIATGVNTAGELASKGVNSVGDVASSATGAVTGAVSGGDRAHPKTPRQTQSWHLPFSAGGDSPEVLESKGVEEVGQWLDDNAIGHLKAQFAKQKQDGRAIMTLVYMWRDNKIGTVQYCETSLKLEPHDALALGKALNDMHAYTWASPPAPEPSNTETNKPETNTTAPEPSKIETNKPPPAAKPPAAVPETGV